MAIAIPMPDYQSLLASFLLTEYLGQLQDARFSEEERWEQIRRLNAYLWTVEDIVPAAAHNLVRAIGGSFPMEPDVRMVPAIEWYLDFLSGKDEQAWRLVDKSQLTRFRGVMPSRIARDRVLRVLMRIELATTGVSRAAETELAKLLAVESSAPVGTLQGLAERAAEVVDFLLREAIAAPPLQGGRPDTRYFALRVLRFGLVPEGAPSPDLAGQVLALAGDIGDEARASIQDAFRS